MCTIFFADFSNIWTLSTVGPNPAKLGHQQKIVTEKLVFKYPKRGGG